MDRTAFLIYLFIYLFQFSFFVPAVMAFILFLSFVFWY